jgi:multiple sugar transport system permease protein
MFSLSLTPNNILQRTTSNLIPPQWTLDNFVTALNVGQMPRWFLNSTIVTLVATLVTLALCAAAGYAFARIDFRGKKIVYPFVLAGLMVPKEAMFIPLFLLFANYDLQNTYTALILPRVATPLGVFIMTQFFKAIPREIEEAAQIDGASRFTIFWKIMLPMSVPALTALAIFTFILTWNDYLWPLVIATRKEMFTLTTGLASLQGNFAQATELGSLMARGVIAIAPLLVLFVLFQRNLIRGIAVSSGGK